MQNNIRKLKKGDIITPKKVDMENSKSNYFRWIKIFKESQEVEDIEGSLVKII